MKKEKKKIIFDLLRYFFDWTWVDFHMSQKKIHKIRYLLI